MSRTFRPRRVLWFSSVLSVALVAAAAFGWWALPDHIRAQFTGFQAGTLAFFIAIMVGFMMAVGLSYVRADDAGLRFRNGLVARSLGWAEITGFRFRHGDPWAYVNHQDPSGVHRQQLLGIQAVEGAAATEAVEYLRARHAQSMPGQAT